MARRPGDTRFTNLTVSVQRNGQPVSGMQNIDVYLERASALNLDMQGVQITTNLLSGTGPANNPDVWQINDVMALTAPGYQAAKYTVQGAQPPPPRGILRCWKIQIKGAVR